jgi:hypothetical protein
MDNHTDTARQARDDAFTAYENARMGNRSIAAARLHIDYIAACDAYNAARKANLKF